METAVAATAIIFTFGKFGMIEALMLTLHLM
jgi:hypothetical protein